MTGIADSISISFKPITIETQSKPTTIPISNIRLQILPFVLFFMNITRFLPKSITSRLPQIAKRSGRFVVAHWDRECLYYLVVSLKPGQLQLISSESVLHSEFPNPLAALAGHL